MIPHRSNDHVQKRSSGRSNRVSSTTLKTPSWPTTTDHGWSARRRRRSRRPGADRACPAAGRRRAARRSARERRPDAAWTLGRATRRRAPTPRSGCAARPRARRRSGASTSSRGRPSQSPWPISRNPGRAGGTARPAASPPSRRRWPRAVSVVRAERRVDDLERAAGRAPAAPARRAASASRSADQRRLPPPDRGQRRVGLALEAALGDERRLAVADRTRVASRPSGMSGGVGPRSAPAPEPDRPEVADRLLRPDRLGHGRRHVVVEREDHERVLARARSGRGASR